MRDDLVARPDAHRHQRQPDRVGAVPRADRVRHAVKRGQLLFELLEHGPLHVLAALEHALHVRVDLRLDVPVLPDVPVKADLHHHLHGLRLLLCSEFDEFTSPLGGETD